MNPALPILAALALLAPGDDAADAARALEQGRYADAEAMFRRADAHGGLARVLEETGRLPEALEAAKKGGDPVLLGNLQAATGDLEGAAATLRGAPGARGLAALGDLLRATGKRKEAMAAYLAANQAWADGGAGEPAEIVAVVHARFAIYEMDPGYERDLNGTFRLLAEPLKAGLPAALLLQADIYTRHDDTEKALSALRPLLLRNPVHPDALVAQARARLRRFEDGEAADLARKALTVNPVHGGALEVLAEFRYADGDRRGAEEMVHRGLAARPKDRALLALDAVRPYLDGDRDGFEAGMRKALAVDPLYARGFLIAARILEDRRRFAEASDLAGRAVAIDPTDPDAWFALARNQLNLGKEKEAKEAIAKASALDPWKDIFRENFATVLEELDGYVSGPTEHFLLRIHAAEDPALRPLYERALEESFRDLRKRYGFDPETPVLAEVFRRASDFSARTLGIPGFGAVGACFGKVVTLDSPAALPQGAFCWRSTLHHELAHVFHLQMTKGRVPRWFTEGLSVHEEVVARPSWNRNMDRRLVDALANDTVRKLAAIDGAFREDVMWAYYQAGLMLGWMERDFGWEKVRSMLALYGKDLEDGAVVRQALGLAPDEFDAAFLAECRRLVAGWSVRPRWSDGKLAAFRRRSEKDPKDMEAHLHLAEACLQRGNGVDAGTALARAQALSPEDPFLLDLRGRLALATLKTPDRGLELLRAALAKGRDHFDLRMTLARAAEKAGRNEEAVEHYRRAKVHFPRAEGRDDPRRELARLYLGLGQRDAAVRETEEIAAQGETALQERLVLAGAYESAADHAGAARILREIVDILPVPGPAARGAGPFPAAEVHARLGRSLARLERWTEAADSLRLAVVVGRTCDPKQGPALIAGWLVEQARAARAAGRGAESKAALQDALRTDPANAEAAELLRSPGDG